MRIKLKGSEKSIEDTGISLQYWQKEYIKNEKYLHYDFYDVGKIVDLYKVNPETGVPEFERCEFEKIANGIISQNRKNYTKKPHDESRLDEYLMPVKKNQSSLSFFKRLKYAKPKIKLDTESKRHITIVLLMIITIVAMFIIAYYQGVFN